MRRPSWLTVGAHATIGGSDWPWALLLAATLVVTACGEVMYEDSIDEPMLGPGDQATAEAMEAERQALAEIDDQLRRSLEGNLAHSAPSEMALDEPEEVTLLLSPVLSRAALAAEIEGEEIPRTATIQMTPWMRARLISANPDAFIIEGLHGEDDQLISTVEPSRWTWLVTPKEGGPQRLVMTVYRLIQVDGRESWRRVESYRYPIEVTVSLGKRLSGVLESVWDFKWWVGGLVFPIIVYWILKRWDR